MWGGSPWTAADALVSLGWSTLAKPNQGVRRRRGHPPHIHRYRNFRNRTLAHVGQVGNLRTDYLIGPSGHSPDAERPLTKHITKYSPHAPPKSQSPSAKSPIA